MRKFTADYIFTLEGEAIPNGLVVTDDSGKILSVTSSFYKEDKEIERHKGVITPGFINAHCHLELSHLLGKIEKGKGLINFIKEIISLRKAEDSEVIKAMQKADKAMYDNGIVAVGDISNVAISAGVKEKSPIKYHTFIEMVGLDPEKADDIVANALELKDVFGKNASITPHAPYTLSKQLLKKVRKYCKENDNLLSIHNQENDEENKLYRYKTGGFVQLYKDLGISLDHFISMSKNTIQAIVPLLPENQRVLMVHNTFTSLKDIYFVKRFSKQIFWCFCPIANKYIENTLPNFKFFKKDDNLICLGTDSLASSHVLSILEEMKVIAKSDKHTTFAELLQWATINGAKFLGFDKELGSIKVGKTPGLNLITDFSDENITEKSTVKKLI
jgi:cytosine/adenosine deaminase-related metal-dependent hydrolase